MKHFHFSADDIPGVYRFRDRKTALTFAVAVAVAVTQAMESEWIRLDELI